jgi:hypothetical protein
VWALFGRGLRRQLEAPGVRRAFNLAMSALVAATALWMLAPLFGAAASAPVDVAREPAYLLGR